ncbi:MAG: DHH family phosphoesterase [Bacteroidota bacterium]
MENLDQLKSFLSIPRDLAIVTHRNPDGDAIGSSLALYHYLNHHGHTVRAVFPSDYPAIFSWMPGIQEVLIYDIEPKEVESRLQKADLIFCLDFNSLDRIDRVGDIIQGCRSPIALIDHHLYPENFAEYNLLRSTASSTCELIYDFIYMMKDERLIDTIISESIFTGILTDTGSFKYSTSPHVFRIVAELLERGADDNKLQDLIFNSLDEKNLRLLGFCLNSRMELLPEYKAGIITLSRRDYEHFDIQRGDTEGIVNFLLKIKEVQVAAFITEQPTIVKISLRSKGEFSVQEIATKHFKGGGHRNASGGYSYKGLRATVLKFKEILAEYKEVLNQI